MLLRAAVVALQLVSLQARTEQHRATLIQTACKLLIIKVASQRLTVCSSQWERDPTLLVRVARTRVRGSARYSQFSQRFVTCFKYKHDLIIGFAVLQTGAADGAKRIHHVSWQPINTGVDCYATCHGNQ
jgi:hypothetical protein